MKVVVVLDQIQAGLGGKEHADQPLGGKQLALGTAELVAKALTPLGAQVIATFYCGTAHYQAQPARVQAKIGQMAKQLGADVVLCGPCFDFPDFAKMAAEIAVAMPVPAVVALAKEKNEEVLTQYAHRLSLLRMPKKGGTGLSQALETIAQATVLAAQGQDVSQYCWS